METGLWRDPAQSLYGASSFLWTACHGTDGRCAAHEGLSRCFGEAAPGAAIWKRPRAADASPCRTEAGLGSSLRERGEGVLAVRPVFANAGGPHGQARAQTR